MDDATPLGPPFEPSPTTLPTLRFSRAPVSLSITAAAPQRSAAGSPAAHALLEPDRRLILKDKSSSPSLKPDCPLENIDEVGPAFSTSLAPDRVDLFETSITSFLVAEPLVILCDVGHPLREPDGRFEVSEEVPLF